jgi:hypothetical protein
MPCVSRWDISLVVVIGVLKVGMEVLLERLGALEQLRRRIFCEGGIMREKWYYGIMPPA